MGEIKIVAIDDEVQIGKMLNYVFREEIEDNKVSLDFYLNPMDSIENILAPGFYQRLIVILDYKLPDMNGLELLKLIKQANSDIEVHMISAFMKEEDIKECLDYGAIECHKKPFDMYKLKETVLMN